MRHLIKWLVLLCAIFILAACQGQEKEAKASKVSQTVEPSTVYIYHTHNRESFLPVLKTDNPYEAHDSTQNIALVGKHLKESLENKNINAVQDTTDIAGTLEKKNLSFKESYSISKEKLEKALEKENVSVALDIHRDTALREETTTKINGENYAKVIFYVSKANKKYYNQSLELAETIHQELEKSSPGISRGVVIRDSSNTYNQDIFPELAVLGVGGPENSLEEEYRTIEKIADVIEKRINK
ncbi:stage II sporulation protein P [Bacillus benzoevorans]|uniref:Stage II sporulation protein P n=1 Tax=Bacillus benzoevorans TaxID=1456 RepID=A0A7X0HSI2_9BACI|nr:stage II sporulation protein P [Bacillus benzoevorans]MBB6446018.1 stage II sporulation protein P [Bacillus benzoevorans]